MHHFKIQPERIKEFRKPLFVRSALFFLFLILIVVIVPGFLSDSALAGNDSLIYVLVLFAIIFPFTIYRSLKRQDALLQSYQLAITDDSIIRTMEKTPTITILKKDVREIIQQANGSITIIGASKFNPIGVPIHIERKDELISLLMEVKPPKVKTSTSWFAKFYFPITLLVVALLFSSFYIDNKIISGIGITVFCLVMIASFVVIQRSKNVDQKIKRMSYIMLIPFLSILYAVIVKLMEW